MKKLLALLTAFMLTVTMIPVTVYAEGEIQNLDIAVTEPQAGNHPGYPTVSAPGFSATDFSVSYSWYLIAGDMKMEMSADSTYEMGQTYDVSVNVTCLNGSFAEGAQLKINGADPTEATGSSGNSAWFETVFEPVSTEAPYGGRVSFAPEGAGSGLSLIGIGGDGAVRAGDTVRIGLNGRTNSFSVEGWATLIDDGTGTLILKDVSGDVVLRDTSMPEITVEPEPIPEQEEEPQIELPPEQPEEPEEEIKIEPVPELPPEQPEEPEVKIEIEPVPELPPEQPEEPEEEIKIEPVPELPPEQPEEPEVKIEIEPIPDLPPEQPEEPEVKIEVEPVPEVPKEPKNEDKKEPVVEPIPKEEPEQEPEIKVEIEQKPEEQQQPMQMTEVVKILLPVGMTGGTVTVSYVENGSTVIMNEGGTVPKDAEITLTAEAAEGYRIMALNYTFTDGETSGYTDPENGYESPSFSRTLTASKDVLVTAVFRPSVIPYALNKLCEGNGTVRVTVDNADATEAVPGKTVLVTLSPSSGTKASLAVTMDENGQSVALMATSDSNVYMFTMPDGPVTVRANFTQKAQLSLTPIGEPYATETGKPVTIGALLTDAGGSPVSGKTLKFAFDTNTVIEAVTGDDGKASATVTPDAFWSTGVHALEFLYSGDSSTLSGRVVTTLTVKAPAQAYHITKSITGAGIAAISVDGTETDTAYSGSTVVITPAAQEGYVLAGVTVMSGGSGLSNTAAIDGTYSFTMPESDVTVSVFFAEKPEVKAETEMVFAADSYTVRQNESVTVTVVLKDKTTGVPLSGRDVTVSYGGTFSAGVTDADGRVSATVTPDASEWPVGSYMLTAGYAGDKNYQGCGASSLLTVQQARKATSLRFEKEAYATEPSAELQLRVYLTDAGSIPLPNQTVRFDISGTGSAALTDANGLGTLTIRFAEAGTYTITATYDGNSTDYLGCQTTAYATVSQTKTHTVSVRIVVGDTEVSGKKEVKTGQSCQVGYNPGSSYTLTSMTIRDAYNNGIATTGPDSNGLYTFTMPDSDVSVTMVYSRSATEPAASKISFYSESYNVSEGGSVEVTVILKDGNGSPIIGKTVSLSVNNATSELVTNTKGWANFPVSASRLDSGYYTMTARFAGDSEYKSSAAATYLQVENATSYYISKNVSSGGTASVRVSGSEVSTAYSGRTVTITPSANSGYVLYSITVRREDNDSSVALSKHSNGTYTFTMPASDVIIGVTYRQNSTPVTDYRIISGGGQSWTKGSIGTLAFMANGTYATFRSVKVDGSAISSGCFTVTSSNGGTSAALNVSYLETLSVGTHTLAMTFSDGVTDGETPIVQFTVGLPAVPVVTGPESKTVNAGSTATFSVSVSGSGSFRYQWQVNQNDGRGWLELGGTGTSYTTGTLNASSSSYRYRCVVSDSYGRTVCSQEATLKVLAKEAAPKTGAIPVGILVAVLAVCLVGLAASAIVLKKRSNKKKKKRKAAQRRRTSETDIQLFDDDNPTGQSGTESRSSLGERTRSADRTSGRTTSDGSRERTSGSRTAGGENSARRTNSGTEYTERRTRDADERPRSRTRGSEDEETSGKRNGNAPRKIR